MKAVHDTLAALRSGAKPADIAGLASSELVTVATRDKAYARWEADFLEPEK